MAVIASGGVCARCNKVYADKSKFIVHHIVPLQPGDYTKPELSLNMANLEVLCMDCHNKEHDRFANEKRVVIVYGAPFSGKSTFVKENMQYGDMVVDMDQLYRAVSGRDLYDKPNGLRFNVFRMHDALIDMIRTRYGYWHTAWIIGGYANVFDRERLIKELKADSVYVEATLEECLDRLSRCNDHRRDKQKDWERYIREWHSTYTPPRF
jgi:shikimate kinase